MTFPSDRISEPRAFLPVICVHGLCFAFAKLIAFIGKFFGSCVYNYSGVQRGQSVSMCFYLFQFHFVGFISSLVVLPFPAFAFLSYPIIVRLCPFVSLRLDIFACILV